MIDAGIIAKVFEQQGLIGILLLYSILQQQRLYQQCVKQRFKLMEFIMECMKKEEDHEHALKLAEIMGAKVPSAGLANGMKVHQSLLDETLIEGEDKVPK